MVGGLPGKVGNGGRLRESVSSDFDGPRFDLRDLYRSLQALWIIPSFDPQHTTAVAEILKIEYTQLTYLYTTYTRAIISL